MPTPPSSGVALWCTERLYASLRTPFASRQEFHIFRLPSHRARGGLNTSLMKGVIATRSRLPPAGTKPDRSGLTASRRTGISASYCCVRASSRVLTSKIRDRPRSNTLDEPLGGRKRVMGLGWGFMGSTHHTARTVVYSGESCTRRSKFRQTGSRDRSSCLCCPSLR